MEEGYYKTKASVEEYIRLAKDVSGEQLIKELARVLPSNAVLLEIGSGPGTDWKILNKLFEVTGSDNSTEFLSHLIHKNPNGEFLELDAVTLNTSKNFDGIYSNKVLHHLSDNELMDSIKSQYALLNTNGIICHSFWKGEGSEVFKGLFVNYHNEADLRKFFGDSFEILSITAYNEFETDDSFLVIGKKK